MLSVKIQVLEDNEGSIDEYSQGYIVLESKYGTLSPKSSIMVFVSLCELLDRVRGFIVKKKRKAELPLGVSSWFEPLLIRDGDLFSFAKSSEEIINKSSQEELTMAILTEAERVCDTYVRNFTQSSSIAEGLHDSIAKFHDTFTL